MKQKRERIDSVYTLRGIGAFIIAFLYHHYHFTQSHASLFGEWGLFFFKNGHLLVETFFMISGFVMALNYKEKILSGDLAFGPYITRRIKHLYPLFFITLLVAGTELFLYERWAGEPYSLYAADFFRFVQNIFLVHMGWFGQKNSFNGPAWCIGVEVFCYIVFYWVCRLGKGRKAAWCLPMMIGLISVYNKWTAPVFNTKMCRGLSCFFIGVLLYEAYAAYRENEATVQIHRINGLLAAAFAAVVLGMMVYGEDWAGSLQMIFIMFFSPVMLWLTISSKPLRYVMELKPLVAVGKLSMSVYLWNVPVQFVFILLNLKLKLGIDFWSVRFFLLNMAATYVTAILSHHFIEKNSIKISERVLRFFAR